MKEIIQELKPFAQQIAQMIKENFGIDIIAWSNSWVSKAVIVAYFICLIYLIIQLLRRKCSFDVDLLELGKLDLYFFWGMCCPLYYLQLMRQYTTAGLGFKIVCFAIFSALMLWLAHEPLKFFLDTIRRYGFSGILYSFSLLGVGLIGILIILVQFIAAALPGLILVCMGVGLAVWCDDGHYRSRNDEEDW